MSKKDNYIIGGAIVGIAATAALSAWVIKKYYPEITPWTNDAEPIPYLSLIHISEPTRLGMIS